MCQRSPDEDVITHGALRARHERLFRLTWGGAPDPAWSGACAIAAHLLALADGLMLHGALDPGAFRWRNIRRAIDVMLAGIEAGG